MATIVLATVAPISHRTAEENLGLGYLAAVLRREGYGVHVVDGWLYGLTVEATAEAILAACAQPLWVGFSCYRSSIERTLECIALIRQRAGAIRIVAGGYGPTIHPFEFLDGDVDVVVRGEAEEVAVALSRALESGGDLRSVPGLLARTSDGLLDTGPAVGPIELDRLPSPARDTLRRALERKSAVHLSTARGCRAHCLFCAIITFGHRSTVRWRQRSLESILVELAALQDAGATVVKIVDDSFIEPPRDAAWCERFAEGVTARGISLSLRASIRADRVTDGVLRALKRAGFYSFSCGVENFAPSALSRMNKSATTADNERALELFHEHGMYVQAGHILFDHATTIEELWCNLRAMRRFTWTITKGIFSEMYAAPSVPYAKVASKLSAADARPTGEIDYLVQDDNARIAYRALKHWHRAHMTLYDMAIDPISAPKAIALRDANAFHEIVMLLKRRDLDLFEDVLSIIDSGATSDTVLEYVHAQIAESTSYYTAYDELLAARYAACGLAYDGEPNPFVC